MEQENFYVTLSKMKTEMKKYKEKLVYLKESIISAFELWVDITPSTVRDLLTYIKVCFMSWMCQALNIFFFTAVILMRTLRDVYCWVTRKKTTTQKKTVL